MPCHTRMKTTFPQGLFWLCLFGLGCTTGSIEPGYLDFDNLPDTNFSCVGKVIGGYYADLETTCQMFHVCTIGQHNEPMDIRFLCLNGTVFDQETRVCERIDEVDCSKSEQFYNLNLELYGNTQAPILEESAETEELPPVKYTSSTKPPSTTPKPLPLKPSRTPSYHTTPPPPVATTARSNPRIVSAHHFPVSSSPTDIRFNPSEINISLNPDALPDVRPHPISYHQQQSFSSTNNNKVVVGTDGKSAPPSVVPITTPKPSPIDVNYGFTYEDAEESTDAVYQRSSSSRSRPTTYRTIVSSTSSLRPAYAAYQRTEKPQRVQIPLPLLPTLSPITFSSPAPFTLPRHHVETKRFTNDHQAPRIVISASASVSDATGRRLNYSLGTIGGTSEVFEPGAYDDYKEEDVRADPFYHDVPKVKTRTKRSAENSTSLVKNEQEAVDILKFLFDWYTNQEKTTKVSVPLQSELITEINEELADANTQESVAEESATATELVSSDEVTEATTATAAAAAAEEEVTATTTTEEETTQMPETRKTTYILFTSHTNKTTPEENTETLESNLASPTVSDYIDDSYEPHTYDKALHDSIFGSSFESGAKWHDSSEEFTLTDRTPRDYSMEFKNFLDEGDAPTTRSSLSDHIRAHEEYLSTLFDERATSPTRSSDDLSEELDDLFKGRSYGSTEVPHRFGPVRSVEDEISMRDKKLRSELGITLESEKLTTTPVVPSRQRGRQRATMGPFETTRFEAYSTYWGDGGRTTTESSGYFARSRVEDKTPSSPVNITQSRKISGDSPGNKLLYNEFLQKATYDLNTAKEKVKMTTDNPAEEPTTSFKFVSIDVIKKHFTMNESKSFDDEEETTTIPMSTSTTTSTVDYHDIPEVDTTESIPTTTTTTTTTTPSRTLGSGRRGRGRSRFREPSWNSSNTRRRKLTTTTTSTTTTTTRPTTTRATTTTTRPTTTTTTTPPPTTTEDTTPKPIVVNIVYDTFIHHIPTITSTTSTTTTTPEEEFTIPTTTEEDYLKNFIASIESTTNSVHISKSDDFWFRLTSTESVPTTKVAEEEVGTTTSRGTTGLEVVPLSTPKISDETTLASSYAELEDILSTLDVVTTTQDATTVEEPAGTTTTEATTTQRRRVVAETTATTTTTEGTTTPRRRFSSRYKKPTQEVKPRQNRRKTTTTTAATPTTLTVSELVKLADVNVSAMETNVSSTSNAPVEEVATTTTPTEATTTEVVRPVVPLRTSRTKPSTVPPPPSKDEDGPSLARSDLVPVTDASLSRSVNPTQPKKPKDPADTTTPLSSTRFKLHVHKSFVFNCFDKEINKFYSDPRDCRLFHYCTAGFSKNQLLDMKFVCDLGTYYDDEKRVCTKEMPARCL